MFLGSACTLCSPISRVRSSASGETCSDFLIWFSIEMYHLLKFRFKSLLAEEYKSLLSIPPPLLEVTVSRCMYYCLIGD